MVDEHQGEMPAKTEQAQEQAPTVTVEQLQADLEAARVALKRANAEAAERRVKLDAYEKAEAAKREAEMTEAQKLQKALEDATNELDTLKRNEIKRRIAAEAGLPDALANRLQGATEDEMRADAQAIKEALPKPAHINPGATNPGNNATGNGETPAQRRARLGL